MPNTRDKCKNCGADYGLHKSDTDQCPYRGIEETRPQHVQQWSLTTFMPVPTIERNDYNIITGKSNGNLKMLIRTYIDLQIVGQA